MTLSGQAGGQAEAQALPGWRDSMAFAADVFEQLRAQTKGEDGIQRPSYGAGEDAAHALMGRLGISLGMEHSIDDAGNLHLTLAGAQREQDRWITGSHLDAVPDGGNFDGAAGVVAGLAVVHALRAAGRTLQRDLTVIGFRAEEGSSWFRGQHKSHFGSRALLGQLGAAEMREALSVVDGRTLWEHIERAGFRPDRIKTGLTHLQTARVHAFVELHIEQGPLLVDSGIPVGIVKGIRGTLRGRNCRTLGEYAHSGAVPRESRHDALFATAELAVALENEWERWLADQRDSVCTMGRFSTDPKRHSLTKVPGEVQFSNANQREARCGHRTRFARHLAAQPDGHAAAGAAARMCQCAGHSRCDDGQRRGTRRSQFFRGRGAHSDDLRAQRPRQPQSSRSHGYG